MSPPHPLENLSRPGGSLKPEPPDAVEIAGLLRKGRARLADAGNTTLALESRFDRAYNGAHALCLAALPRTTLTPAHRKRQAAPGGIAIPWGGAAPRWP